MSWLERLREIKSQSSLSTREIAEKSGLPEPTLEKLFSGQTKNPGINSVQQLVHALGYTLDDIDEKNTKKAPSELSEEAHKIAKSYEKLTDHGKGAVKAILGYEEKALEHYSKREDEDGKIVTLPTSKRNGHGFKSRHSGQIRSPLITRGCGFFLTLPVVSWILCCVIGFLILD